MLSYLIFGVSLIALAAVLSVWHLLVWRSAQHQPTGAERGFVRRQTVRRLQTSFLLGLTGALIALLAVLPARWLPYGILALLLLVGWILLLAGLDFWHARQHYAASQLNLQLERRALEEQLEEIRRHEKNGTAGSKTPPPEDA